MKKHPRAIIADIADQEGTGSMKVKKSIVEEHLDVPEFVKTVEYALNPWKQYYVTTVPGLTEVTRDARRKEKEKRTGYTDMFEDTKKLTWSEQFATMFTLLDDLSSRKLPPNSSTSRGAILEWAKKCGAGTIEVFKLILQKDLRCGMKAKSFNKIKENWVPEFSVQLAQPFDEKKLQFPCFVDPKYDGERVLAFITFDGAEVEVTYWSRNGNQYHNFGCFDDHLAKAFAGQGCCVADCEVINKKGFQTLQKTPKYFDANFDTSGLHLVVFDWIPQTSFDTQTYDLNQQQRYKELSQIFKTFKSDRISLVDTRLAQDYNEALKIFEYWVEQGLEGIILKQPEGKYEFKRSYEWMKLKPKASEDLRIIGMELGDSNKQWAGKCGSLIVERKDRNTGNLVKIGVASGLTHHHHENICEVGDQILYTNPDGEVINLKGKLIEVVYDNVTEDGSLRFPRIKPRGLEIIRTDKD